MNEPPPAALRAGAAVPAVARITLRDVAAALRLGIGDFLRAPQFGLFFAGIYVAGGIGIYLLLRVYDLPWMILPIAVGFPLIGPFVAVGLYEVSRRQMAGRPLEWRQVLSVIFAQRNRQLGWMAFVVLFIFWIWIYQVRILLAICLGYHSISTLEGFLGVVIGTADGLTFLCIGSLVGAALSFVLFCSTVTAIPLLLDRDLDVVTAIITSFRSVLENPYPMIGWGIAVAALTVAALLPMFLGLFLVLPVLGHATWHLYLRVLPAPGTTQPVGTSAR